MDDLTDERRMTVNPAEWVDRHGDYLFRYAMSRLHDAEAAEEAVQETFVAGLGAIDQYKGRGAERAWLLGILKRKIVDQVRQRNRTTPGEGASANHDLSEVLFDRKGKWRDDPRIFGSQPDATLERDEFWQAFRSCLDSLPQRQADAFTLRELDEKISDEICKDLEISPSNLWVLLYRARLGLANCLKSRWQHEGGH
ncbi:MAG: sigma-70 family RNA polymerase sigma factor [Planctomycetes bacterium]|nr:sigma-70 family RNA polymerase sigma factor [Planctomycetota bacterium]